MTNMDSYLHQLNEVRSSNNLQTLNHHQLNSKLQHHLLHPPQIQPKVQVLSFHANQKHQNHDYSQAKLCLVQV